MKICVVGTGYVGLVAGTCLSDLGHDVTCVDTDAAKIAGLHRGKLPIYEPGLDEVIERNVARNRLHFTTDGDSAIREADVVYIAVGTPPAEDGSADMKYVYAVAAQFGRAIQRPTVLVTKSTVPVGTADRVRAIVSEQTDIAFDVVSNPEFLREGQAISDFMHPDRIVVGCQEESTRDVMRRVYKPLIDAEHPIYFMDNRSAEMAKYAANSFLATRLSFINELSRVCEAIGADIEAVRLGSGSDSRVGLKFFYPGVGYGGSCFPKDVQALMFTAREAGSPMTILKAVEDVNYTQKRILAHKVVARFGEDLTGKTFAVWGLAFKPGTDDMREAPSRVIIGMLLERGATIQAYDPEAMEEASHLLHHERLDFVETAEAAVAGADALLLITEWNEFRSPNWEQISAALRGQVIFDGRNIYEPARMRGLGFEYHCIGRPLLS